MSIPGVAKLAREVTEFRNHSVAASTRKLHETQWRCYKDFCLDLGIPVFPCDVENVSLYIAFLAPLMKTTSINSYLQGLVFKYVVLGMTPPKLNDPHIKSTLSGVKNKYATPPDRKDPLFLFHLKAMSHYVDHKNESLMLTWLSCILMFRCLLRVGQVVTSPHTLLRSSIQFTDYGMLLCILSSKTTTRLDPPSYVPVNRFSEKKMCIIL